MGKKQITRQKPSLDSYLYFGSAIPTNSMALVSLSEGQWSWSPLIVDIAKAAAWG